MIWKRHCDSALSLDLNNRTPYTQYFRLHEPNFPLKKPAKKRGMQASWGSSAGFSGFPMLNAEHSTGLKQRLTLGSDYSQRWNVHTIHKGSRVHGRLDATGAAT